MPHLTSSKERNRRKGKYNMSKIEYWKVYGQVPYKIWIEFKLKCNVDDIDKIIINAIKEEIRKSGD